MQQFTQDLERYRIWDHGLTFLPAKDILLPNFFKKNSNAISVTSEYICQYIPYTTYILYQHISSSRIWTNFSIVFPSHSSSVQIHCWIRFAETCRPTWYAKAKLSILIFDYINAYCWCIKIAPARMSFLPVAIQKESFKVRRLITSNAFFSDKLSSVHFAQGSCFGCLASFLLSLSLHLHSYHLTTWM